MKKITEEAKNLAIVSKVLMIVAFGIAIYDLYMNNAWSEFLAFETINSLRVTIIVIFGILFGFLSAFAKYIKKEISNENAKFEKLEKEIDKNILIFFFLIILMGWGTFEFSHTLILGMMYGVATVACVLCFKLLLSVSALIKKKKDQEL